MLTFRIAGKETVSQQMEIFNNVFDENATLTSWNRKHYENPMTNEEKLYGAFDGEKLIGINGFLEMKYVYGDKEFKAIQSCDTAVDPDYRGRGIFTKIIMSAEEEFTRQGYDLMIGYPNFNSYPGFLKMGWKEMTRTNKLFIPTNVQNMVKHMKGINLTKISNLATWFLWHNIRRYARRACKIDIRVNDTITSEEYNQYIDKDFVYLKIDEPLLSWKLEDLVASYTILKNEKEICKFVICKYDYGDQLKRANIILAECLEEYTNEYQYAMAKILLDKKNEFDLICIWEPKSESKKKCLKKLGFLNNIVAKEGSPFIIKILTNDDEKIKILSNSDNWNPKQIETDTMINLSKR